MVSATVAEATPYGVTIKRSDGVTLKVSRASLADAGWPHGINTDEADDLVEREGFVAGVWRWQERGGFFKAVVTPEGQLPKYRPHEEGMLAEEVRRRNVKAFGNPEGRRR